MKTFLKHTDKKMLAAVFCAFLAICFSFIFYQIRVDRDINQDMRNQVDALLTTFLRDTEYELDYFVGLNENTARFMAGLQLNDSLEILNVLSNYIPDENVLQVFCLTEDGHTYTNYSGEISSLPEGMPEDYSAYFSSEDSVILPAWYSSDYDDILFGILSPVKLGHTNGLLMVTYPVSLFYKIFENDFLDGFSEIAILKNDCTVVLGKDLPGRHYQFGLHIIDEMLRANTKFTIGSALDIQHDITSGIPGFSAYYVENTERYCAFSPIAGTDWYLIVMAQEIILRDQSNQFTVHGMILTIMLVTVMTGLLLIILLLHYNTHRHTQLTLEKAATTDSLTGIMNRGTAENSIISHMEANSGKTPMALMIIDIDNFKNINDTYGHIVGDHILQKLADLLKECFSPGSIIGRMGGDEFIVLLKNCSSREAAVAQIQPLLQPVLHDDPLVERQISISVSIGICLSSSSRQSFMELYQLADKALYQAKDLGKNSYSFY